MNNNFKKIFFSPIKCIYQPSGYKEIISNKIKTTLLYLLLLSMIVNILTVIVPYAPIILEGHGVKNIINVLVPDFSYENGEVLINDFKCDINEDENSIFLIDTSKELSPDILKPYNNGFIIGKNSLIKKENNTVSEYVYKNYLPINKFSKNELLSTKTILLIYITLCLIVLFSHLFLFLLLLFETLLLLLVFKLINVLIFKIKLQNNFKNIFNISAYTLCGATLLKTFLQSFNIAPLPFNLFNWFTIIQLIYSLTMGILTFLLLKKSNQEQVLNISTDSSLSPSEKLEQELGFSQKDLDMKKFVKEQALKLNEELKQNKKIIFQREI